MSPRESYVARSLRELVAHLERAELSLGDVKVRGAELVKAHAAFADVQACQKILADLEVRAGG